MVTTVGVDIGGTFTEAVAVDAEGGMNYAKTPTTYDDLAEGVFNALAELASLRGETLEELLRTASKFAHGTTHTVNAMIQRKGAKTGLITTKGFRDHFIIMKGGRGVGLPDSERTRLSRVVKPEPLVPYSLTEEVSERVDYAGRILVPVDEAEVKRSVTELVHRGIESLAISTLWSFRNPKNELAIRKYARELAPDLFITISSELTPVMGEYERTTTVVLNSYLGPILQKYCLSLQKRLWEKGLKYPLMLMQSVGGLIPAGEAPQRAVTTLISGLAGGVIASQFIANDLGYKNVITTDMGGTSFEVGMIVEGNPTLSLHPLTPRAGPYISRYTVHVPMIDITAIGAGGGSIAWINRSLIRVGPLSAGSRPGPACYAQGGEEPTVTDADLTLGFLNPKNFLGGRMQVSPERAYEAIRDKIAKELGMDPIDAAKGIEDVVNNEMADLLRKTTIERGYDPRDFVIFGFGGAGPVHCPTYGRELGVSRILIPGRGFATAHSAFGVAISDLKQTYALTDPMVAPVDIGRINHHFHGLELKAKKDLSSWGVEKGELALIRSIDMRYRRQVHEVNVPVMGGTLTDQDLDEIDRRFEQKYELIYGKGAAYREAGMEMVTFRVDAVGYMLRPKLKKHPTEGASAESAFVGYRQVLFQGYDDFTKTNIFDGDRLKSGNVVEGPGIIEYPGTTVSVNPGQRATLDEYLNIAIASV